MLMQLVVTQKEHGNAFVIKVMKETELIVKVLFFLFIHKELHRFHRRYWWRYLKNNMFTIFKTENKTDLSRILIWWRQSRIQNNILKVIHVLWNRRWFKQWNYPSFMETQFFLFLEDPFKFSKVHENEAKVELTNFLEYKPNKKIWKRNKFGKGLLLN